MESRAPRGAAGPLIQPMMRDVLRSNELITLLLLLRLVRGARRVLEVGIAMYKLLDTKSLSLWRRTSFDRDSRKLKFSLNIVYVCMCVASIFPHEVRISTLACFAFVVFFGGGGVLALFPLACRGTYIYTHVRISMLFLGVRQKKVLISTHRHNDYYVCTLL